MPVELFLHPLFGSAGVHWLDQILNSFAANFSEGSFFNQVFNLRAMLALALVSLTCGAVGSMVVGSRMAFFSDALAHCAFAGVSLGYVIFELFILGARPKEEFWEWVTPIMVVFGIAVGKVWHEVEGSLATLQGEVNGEAVGGENNDELSLRRKAKGA